MTTGGRYWALLLGACGLSAALAVLVHRHLMDDCAYFLTRLLVTRGFTHFDPPRQFAHYLLQGPLMVALHGFGIRDLEVLSWVFGATLLGHPLASLWACWQILQRRNPALIILPALCHIALLATTGLFVISESWLALSLFWPSYFLLQFHRHRLTFCEGLALLSCACVLIRAYEASCLSSLLLLCLAVRRGLWQWRAAPWRDGWVLVTGLALAASMVCGLYWGLNPWNPGGRSMALRGLLKMVMDPAVTLSAVFLASFVAGEASRVRLGVLLAFSTAWALVPWIAPSNVLTHAGYDNRLVNNLLPLLLGLMPLLAARKPALHLTFAGLRPVLLAAFAGAVLLEQAGVSWRWWQYTTQCRQILATRQGLVPFEASGLPPFGRTGIVDAGIDATWGWTSPTLSILLQGMDGRSVRTLILNPAEIPSQPFDPASRDPLPRLEPYGVHYRLEVGP